VALSDVPKIYFAKTYGALWFSKLNILTDKYEGVMPKMADAEMLAEHQKYKALFGPALHEQIDNMNERNVEDGRELIVVNCWFVSETESERMWKEYGGGSESVAIKSTIRLLSESIACDPRTTRMGKVQYVDLDAHSMSHYEASQAQERAFLKSLEFSHEQEVRIATLSVKRPMCVNMDGTTLKPEQYQGAAMNNFENPGLYLRADLRRLIKAIVVAPDASTWFESLVKRIVDLSNVGGPAMRSTFDSTSGSG
jgi:hypothetical protein